MNKGDRVRVIGQDGNVCATGTYHGMGIPAKELNAKLPHLQDRKSTRLNSSHVSESRMPSSA